MQSSTHQKNPKECEELDNRFFSHIKGTFSQTENSTSIFLIRTSWLIALCDLINNKNNLVIAECIHFNINNRARQYGKCEIKLTKKTIIQKRKKIFGQEQPISIILSKNTQTLQTTNIQNFGSVTFIGCSYLEVSTKLICAPGKFAACASHS